MPPVAVHVTAVLLGPVTVAVNWRVAPGCERCAGGRDAEADATLHRRRRDGAEALLVVSWTLVAVTVKVLQSFPRCESCRGCRTAAGGPGDCVFDAPVTDQ